MVGLFVVGAVLLSAFFYPIWTAEVIRYQDWRIPYVDAVLDLGQDGKGAGGDETETEYQEMKARTRNGDWL